MLIIASCLHEHDIWYHLFLTVTTGTICWSHSSMHYVYFLYMDSLQGEDEGHRPKLAETSRCVAKKCWSELAETDCKDQTSRASSSVFC